VTLKIGVPLVIITVLVALVFGLAAVNDTKSRLDQSFVPTAHGIATNTQDEWLATGQSRMDLQSYIDNLIMNQPGLVRVRLFADSGGRGSVWMSTFPADTSMTPTAEEVGVRNDQSYQQEVSLSGQPALETVVPLQLGNSVVAMGLFNSLEERDAAVEAEARRAAVVGAGVIALELVVLFTTFYFVVLKRVKRLEKAAVAVAEGDYSIRPAENLKGRGGDELDHVTREFDRMITTVEARTNQQAAVADLGQLALQGTDIPALLDRAAAVLAEHLRVPHTAVLQYTQQGSLLVCAGTGWREGVVGYVTVDADRRSQSGFTMRSAEPVILDDLEHETRFEPSALQREYGIRSGITVLIPGNEQPFGILAAHTDDMRRFTTEDVNFAQSIANVLATGIERRDAEDQVAFMAHHDELTALPNRAMFEELLDLAIARARRNGQSVAVMFMDLDNFKLVNDTLGHAAGDQLLAGFAERLREATRDTDLVARQGGDEFLVLLADIDRQGEGSLAGATDNANLVTESVAVRIQQSLESPFVLAGEEFYASASIGISMFPADASDGRSLLKNADAAMYRSKKTAPGGYAMYSATAAEPGNKLSMTTRLRKAVESRNWILHYQPVVDLTSGDILAVEALLRWQDPNGGIIPPGDFIPLAEEMGLIVAIGDWVMEEIYRQQERWQRMGIDLDIGFNVSPRQLWQPDIVDKVLRFLSSGEIDPAKFEIEITESSAMTDPEKTQRILWDLHARGLRLAIDDFGTGYSSLSRLKHMPVSTLKIDRSFVMDIPDDPDAGNMVTAVVALARSLGMTPLAEGIETEAQWRFLEAKGCKLGQGYFFSRPVPATEIEAMFERNGGPNLLDEVARRAD
jgi:diguanylate cyclase (GGDEF)-like protein